jgi:hypothetical protein
MTDSQPLDPTEAFRRLGRMPLGDTDVKGVLDQVAHLAACTIPGADDVSVTLVNDKDAYRPPTPGGRLRASTNCSTARGYGLLPRRVRFWCHPFPARHDH